MIASRIDRKHCLGFFSCILLTLESPSPFPDQSMTSVTDDYKIRFHHNILSDFVVNIIMFIVYQRCTTFLGQGPQWTIFGALEGRRQGPELNFRKLSIKSEFFFDLTSLFCCLWFDIVAIRAFL